MVAMKGRILFNKLLFTIVLSLLFSPLAMAKARRVIGKVIQLRGQVTQLAPGERIARKVSRGDSLKEDSSVLTRAKSFVQIRLEDGSLINIGPESKMVVASMNKNGDGIVNLLKGKVRYDIKQNYEGNKKFYVRTRNTALGVRGTEFETVYNPQNKITSLLTYTGEVAMVKTNDGQDQGRTDLKKAKRIVRDFNNSIILEEEPSVKVVGKKELEELLKNDPVVVKRGQLSQTVEKIDDVSRPVKISPVQLNALYANQTFEEKTTISKLKGANLDSSKAQLILTPAEQEVPPEGVFDEKNKIYAPKAGGFFDRETGLYVPPSSDALFDQKNKVYYASNSGAIDEDTGQYIPPVGLELDAKEGFVTKKLTKDAPAQFVAQVENSKNRLNQSLARDVVIDKGAIKTEASSFRPLSNRELISKNVFSVRYSPYTQTITQEGDRILGGSREFESESTRDIVLNLDYASGSRWQPTSSFTFRSLKVPDSQLGSLGQSGDSLTSLSVGLKYSLNPRWNIVANAALDQQYFLHHTTENNATASNFIRITIPKFIAGVEGSLIRSGRLSLDTGLSLGTNLGKTSGSHKLNALGFNLNYFAKVKYWLSRLYFVDIGLQGATESYSTEGTSVVYEADVSRSQAGFFVTLSTYF